MSMHETYMREALQEAQKALIAGEFPVGCVMVSGNEIVSRGRRINSRAPNDSELDHAEIMALRKLFVQHPEIERSGIVVYTTMEPCLMCLGALILSGISEIVYAYEDVMGGGLNCDLSKLPPLYANHPLSIVPNILRQNSLELFKAFFNTPENSYWRGSLLAEYTLRQS